MRPNPVATTPAHARETVDRWVMSLASAAWDGSGERQPHQHRRRGANRNPRQGFGKGTNARTVAWTTRSDVENDPTNPMRSKSFRVSSLTQLEQNSATKSR